MPNKEVIRSVCYFTNNPSVDSVRVVSGLASQMWEKAMSLANGKHILRVIIDRKDDTIKVVTFHIARRGKYETTLR